MKEIRNWLIGLSAVVILGIVVYVVYSIIPPRPGDDPYQCRLVTQQRTATIDLNATVADLDLAKLKLGMTAGDVDPVSGLLKTWTLQYTAACVDHSKGVLNDAEYSCRRSNMDRALNAIEALRGPLELAKSIQDPASLKEVIVKHLDIIREVSQAGYAKNCTSVMTVSPADLTFAGLTLERTFELASSGSREVMYVLEGLPQGFVALHQRGKVSAAGPSTVVALKRIAHPLTSGDHLVNVVGNDGSRTTLRLIVDDANARLFEHLAAVAFAGLASAQGLTVEDALAVLPPGSDPATRHLMAAGVLKAAGAFAQSAVAIEKARELQPDLIAEPPAQVFAGIVAYRTNNWQDALKYFSTPDRENGALRADSIADVYRAAVLTSLGRTNEASDWLRYSKRGTAAEDVVFFNTVGHDLALADFPRHALLLASRPPAVIRLPSPTPRR